MLSVNSSERLLMPKLMNAIKRLFAVAFEAPKKQWDFDLIQRLHQRLGAGEHSDMLDDQTWQDLELEAHFRLLDDTVSPLGQQWLYHCLRSCGGSSTADTLKHCQRLAGDDAFHQRVRQALYLLRGGTGFHVLSFIHRFHVRAVPPTALLVVLGIVPLAVLASLAYTTAAAPWLLLSLAINFITARLYEGRVEMDMGQLAYINRMAVAAVRIARDKAVAEHRGLIEDVGLVTTKVRPDWRIRWMTMDKSMSADTPNGVLLEYLNSFLLLELICYGLFADRIVQKRAEYEALLMSLAKLDMLQGLVTYVSRYDSLCAPVISGNEMLSVNGIYHPAIDHPVTNSFAMLRQVVVITGANMAGKSTFMKCLGLNYVLGRSLGFCHASEATFPMVRLRSSLSLRDTIQEGASYFFKEITRLREMIDDASRSVPALFLVDEPFKGTNRPERLAALSGVGHYMAGRAFFMLSTHDTELCADLDDAQQVQFTSGYGADGELRYDYRLRPGVSRDRYALALMAKLDYPHEILSHAQARFATNHDPERVSAPPM